MQGSGSMSLLIRSLEMPDIKIVIDEIIIPNSGRAYQAPFECKHVVKSMPVVNLIVDRCKHYNRHRTCQSTARYTGMEFHNICRPNAIC
jgi:hypothetical protein